MNAYKKELATKLLTQSNCALLVVDMQNDYIHPNGVFAKTGSDNSRMAAIVPVLQDLIDTAHEYDIPLVFIQTTHQKETDTPVWLSHSGGKVNPCCRVGTWGAEFYGVSPKGQDIVVNKYRYSAFTRTRLDTVLRGLGVDTVIMSGVLTNTCVESTARDAYLQEYYVLFVEDCCASNSQKLHEAALENIDTCFGIVLSACFIKQVLQLNPK